MYPGTLLEEKGPYSNVTMTTTSQLNDLYATPGPKIPASRAARPSTIDELVRQRALENPDRPTISYPSSGIDYVHYTAQQIDIFAFRVAQKYKLVIPQRKSSSEPETVVGLLGPSNFDYLITILALTKLGHTVLVLSTRLSVVAYNSLVQKTKASHLIVDKTFLATAAQIKQDFPLIDVHPILGGNVYENCISMETIDTGMCHHFVSDVESKKTALIIHSSGSSGLPKPISIAHHAGLSIYSSIPIPPTVMSTFPLFHAAGLNIFFATLFTGNHTYHLNASLPVTQQNLLNVMQKYKFGGFYGVPYTLKILAESSEGIAALAACKEVMFAGAPCPDTLGNKLVDNGVNLFTIYASTECGTIMNSAGRPDDDKAWNYMRLRGPAKIFANLEPQGDGTFECVMRDGWPPKQATNRPDGAFATSDLFIPHPTIPDAWKYFARKDDTMVLLNGEKIVPTLFEQLIRNDPLVTEAVMFGHGKSRPGLIIITSEAGRGLASDELKNALLPALELANQDAPAHGQISLDMVEVFPAGMEYPKTDKGTVRRGVFFKHFEAEIEKVYENANSARGELRLSEAELREFLHTEIAKLFSNSTAKMLKDDTDLFSMGIDSLQAIQIRSVLIRNIDTNGNQLGSNILFDFPSITALAQELYRLRTGGQSTAVSSIDQMKELINKYSAFESHVAAKNSLVGKYMVVTGATGSLGAHIISQLSVRDDVKKVYCLVRASSTADAHERVVKSLHTRAVYNDIPAASLKKLVALPSNLNDPSLGLSSETYTEIVSSVSDVIHCAWNVNFNLGLSSFEDCVSGSHNLIALCLAAHRPLPATFNFCSSISAALCTSGDVVPEALPKSLENASEMGYGRSKLVTEHICAIAAEDYRITTRVLRVGQIVADTAHGVWNAQEAISMMMQSGLTIGALPTLDEEQSWLPVDVVASTVIDISLAASGTSFTNIVNHQRFHWTKDLLPMLHRAGLDFKEVRQREWIQMLRANQDPVANPPVKLLDHFAGRYDNDTSEQELVFETDLARNLSPSLAAARGLEQDFVDKFVNHFMDTAWASPTNGKNVEKSH